MTPLIQVHELSILREDDLILEEVTFSIDPEEYVGIVGPNGGGKTTLLLALLGLIKPQAGSIQIQGHAPQNASARRLIGYVPQTFLGRQFSFPISVEEVVATGLLHKHFFGMIRRHQWEQVQETLKEVGLQRYAKRSFHELSGGERQRVIIARALVSHPEILILDEPLSAVDQPSQDDFYELLSLLNKEKGITILLVSHDLEVVAKEASRVLCLNQHLSLNCKTADLPHDHQWAELFGEQTKLIHHHNHA